MDKEQLCRLVSDFLEFTRTENERFHPAMEAIVGMTFLSSPEEQWQMVLEAVRQSQSDADLGHVAAGPIEGLLGKHGSACIGWVEKQASLDPKFARTMTGVWKHLMTDDVWKRVQAIQGCVDDPLESYRRNR